MDIPEYTKNADYPSIRNQGLNVGYFDFGKAKTPFLSFYNCGLVNRPDGLWLITRRSENHKLWHIGHNSLMSFRLEGKIPTVGIPVKLKTFFEKEHYEDPRAIWHRGKTYVLACNFIMVGKHWTGSHQTVSVVDDHWNVQQRFDPVYGFNGSGIGQDTGLEKNWIWFFKDDLPHLVYSATPHRVVKFTENFDSPILMETGSEWSPWDYGEIRGGTPPVLVDGEYWTFFHSSINIGDPYHRRYYMGAYAFSPNPPFEMTRITLDPLLAGSRHDEWYKGKPLVVFPCGAHIRDGNWLVTMGVNDLFSAWLEISHDELVKKTVALKTDNLKPTLTFIDKPKLKDVTLVCVDDVNPDLAVRAMRECTRKIQFEDVKFFTSHKGYPDSVIIPPIRSLESYSRFMIRELNRYIKTRHILVVQWDGYVLDHNWWRDDWLNYDYVGSPFHDNVVGNGGFSLRSKKLLEALAHETFVPPYNPEDEYICRRRRPSLENDLGIRFAPAEISRQFATEGEQYSEQFGFHNFLSALPPGIIRPLIFNHSGDFGDILYSLPVIRAMKGGVLFLTPNENLGTRKLMTQEHAANILALLNLQPYVTRAAFSGRPSHQTDYDLNGFRRFYRNGNKQFGESLVALHARSAGIQVSSDPWLEVDYKMPIDGKNIIINRSGRYHNLNFPWNDLVKEHGRKMLFLGTLTEHGDFVQKFGEVDYCPTSTLLEAARLIAAARLFIGNQSALMAIALGIGGNVIQETWDGPRIELGDLNVPWSGQGDPNCKLIRSNAIYVTDKLKQIPKGWI